MKLYIRLFMNYRISLCCAILLLTLNSCGPDYIFEKTYQLEADTWTYADSLVFEVDVEDTLKIYNLYLYLEHHTDYSFQNLYTKINTRFPSGQQISETLSLELQHKSGMWLGDCGRTYCELRIPIQEGAYFNSAGQHTIVVNQHMRTDSIKGVKSLSLRIEDTGESR